MRDDLLLYYERELDFLRRSGALFAEKHPKIASRLVLEPARCEDPHVERMLEAFAFLAARIHLKMDDEFPEVSDSLLGVLYPLLVRPIPSMSVVEFQPDPDKGKLTTGLNIKRDSLLYSKPVGGVPCTFRTCYDTMLWPISVTETEWLATNRLKPLLKANDAAWAVRLQLHCAPDVSFASLRAEELRFYLDGESGFINILYELLFTKLVRVVVRDPTPGSKVVPVTLPGSALQPVGFEANQGMVPYTAQSFVGHRLLMEYFAFPEKFFFINLTGLRDLATAGFKEAVEIVFLVSDVERDGRLQRLELELSKKTFRLGCSPVVNLFSQTAEPIQLSLRKYEYPVTPDVRRPLSMEIYSVDEVRSIDSAEQRITPIEPFYSLRQGNSADKQRSFWTARRKPSTRPNDDGTEMFLSLIDLAQNPAPPNASVLSLRTTCTNRDLPSRLPFGNQDSDFEMEGSSVMRRIVALRKPTAPIRPALGKGGLWRLISHLSLNHLSLVEGGREALQQILRIYDFGRTAYSQNVIDSILRVQSRRHFARLSTEEGISFVRGTRIELELDEDRYTGSGPYLFAAVLERFFGLSASLNSFTQLAVTTSQRSGPLREWQPRSGRRILV